MSVALPQSTISTETDRGLGFDLLNTIKRGIIAPESLTYLEISGICQVAATVYGDAVDRAESKDLRPLDISAAHRR